MTVDIDVHGHIVVEEILRSSSHDERLAGPRSVVEADGRQMMRTNGMNEGPIPKEAVDWPRVIENLDATKVDLMAVSPVPPLFLYHLDGKTGLYACQVQNDAIAGAVSRYPTRLAGLGVVPLQDVDLAVKELERAVRDLRMPGVEIGTNIQGTYPGDPSLRPFWAAVEDLDAFVFIHPYSPFGETVCVCTTRSTSSALSQTRPGHRRRRLLRLAGGVPAAQVVLQPRRWHGALHRRTLGARLSGAHRDQGQDRQAAERVLQASLLRQHHSLRTRARVPRGHRGCRPHHDRF